MFLVSIFLSSILLFVFFYSFFNLLYYFSSTMFHTKTMKSQHLMADLTTNKIKDHNESLLTLQIFSLYTFLYIILFLVLFEYKNYALKYAPEVIDTIILFFYEIIRLYIESQTNRGVCYIHIDNTNCYVLYSVLYVSYRPLCKI